MHYPKYTCTLVYVCDVLCLLPSNNIHIASIRVHQTSPQLFHSCIGVNCDEPALAQPAATVDHIACYKLDLLIKILFFKALL